MTINDAGLTLIKEFEGCKLKAYPDPGSGGDPWTIGYGHTGVEVAKGLIITQDKADELLAKDVGQFAQAVHNFCQVPLTSNQFAALVSFAYNVKGWRSSTLFKLIRAKKYAEAAQEFPRWVYASGKVMNGLKRRRAAEQKLFLTE